MSEIEGLWIFEATRREDQPEWAGFGVAFLQNGHIYGGDSGYFWRGTYQPSPGSEQFTLQAKATQYNPTARETIWGARGDFELRADITPDPADPQARLLHIRMSKTPLSVRMRKVSDAG